MLGNFNELSNVDVNRNNLRLQDSNKFQYNPAVKNEVENKTAAGVTKKEANKIGDCETCANRRYQDGSNDPG